MLAPSRCDRVGGGKQRTLTKTCVDNNNNDTSSPVLGVEHAVLEAAPCFGAHPAGQEARPGQVQIRRGVEERAKAQHLPGEHGRLQDRIVSRSTKRP